MKNFLLKTMFCALLLASVNSPLLAQTDSAQTTAASKTGIRRVVEKVFGEHDSIITQGIQHTAMWLPSPGLALGYDLRMRTANRHFDWAVQGSLGVYGGRYTNEYLRPSTYSNATVGISGLLGKRALSFELGLQGEMLRRDWQQLNFRDYKTDEEMWVKKSTTDFRVGMPVGGRFQPVTGGVFFTLALIPTYSFTNTLIVNPTLLNNLQFNIKVGLGYTFRTKPRK